MDDFDELEAAINTYMLLVINENPFFLDPTSDVVFFIDPSDFPHIHPAECIEAAKYIIKILEFHEHYEKCGDLIEYIKTKENEVKRLSRKNS